MFGLFSKNADLELISLIVDNNDREAADELIRRYYKYIYKEIVVKVNDDELALDLTQESFIAALKGLSTFNSTKASFKTWLVRIASNKVIDYYRSRQHHENIMTDILEGYDKEDEGNMEASVINSLSSDGMDYILRGEKKRDREIVMLKVEEGMTFEEIGQKLGMTKAKVKSRYYNTLKRLRREMADYEKDKIS